MLSRNLQSIHLYMINFQNLLEKEDIQKLYSALYAAYFFHKKLSFLFVFHNYWNTLCIKIIMQKCKKMIFTNYNLKEKKSG